MMRPHKNLTAWQESISLVRDVYTLTTTFPDSEKFGLISQLRRATVSIPANISEGAARNTKKEFIHFLYISSGSLSEVDTLFIISANLEYISPAEYHILDKKMNRINSMLHGLIRKLKTDQ